MRAVVALVEAGPDTIIEDYGRVLDLAGLPLTAGGEGIALVPQTCSGGWLPGAGSPPWQLDGALTWLGKRPEAEGAGLGARNPVVLPVSPAGGQPAAMGWAREDVMARHGVDTASEHFRRPRAFRAEPALPALEAALSQGLGLPTGLRDRTTLLLPVPSLPTDRPVSGAVNLMRALLAPGLGRSRQSSDLEILADVLRFSRQALPGMAVVMDGVFWQIGQQRSFGPTAWPAVARNVLLAGSDPVAVDVVAARLAGREPERDPWYRLCRDLDLGAVRRTDIRLAGRADLMDLDFEVPDNLAGGPQISWDWFPGAKFFSDRFQRPALVKRHARTPWGRLYDDYRAGRSTGDME